MEIPREDSPAVTVLPSTTHTSTNRKRKHAAVSGITAAASPAPSEGGTPAPTTTAENVLLKHADLSTRPRLKISRHPSFVPVAPGSQYYTTEPVIVNRLNFRYTPAGLTEPGSLTTCRTIESLPTSFRVSWEDRSPFVKVTPDGLGLQGERGFRSARCNAPMREGKWYLEIKIELGGGEKPPDSKRKEGAHVRLGWARREAPLSAPAGLDGYSYAYRDKTGEKVTLSRPKPYGKPFKSGDVIGMYISLPPRRKPNPRDPFDPAHIKRERIAIDFKGQEYFESLEYTQSKEMKALMDANDKSKTNSSTPAPVANKKSATVKNLPSIPRGKAPVKPEVAPLRPLPTLGPDSYIAFFVNGESQGIAFQDLYDYLPLRHVQNKTQEKKRHKDGIREHKDNYFDDGTLGYYPIISLFNEARVRINPGPDFEFPPPPDIDAVLAGDVKEDVKPSGRTWRPACDRYPEFMAEQFALDDLEEAEAQKNQQAGDMKEEEEADKLEQRRAKRRAQAAAARARKERDKKQKEEETESKRRRTEEPPDLRHSQPLPHSHNLTTSASTPIHHSHTSTYTPTPTETPLLPSSTSLPAFSEYQSHSSQLYPHSSQYPHVSSQYPQTYSPAPSPFPPLDIPLSVHPATATATNTGPNSEYNTDFEEAVDDDETSYNNTGHPTPAGNTTDYDFDGENENDGEGYGDGYGNAEGGYGAREGYAVGDGYGDGYADGDGDGTEIDEELSRYGEVDGYAESVGDGELTLDDEIALAAGETISDSSSSRARARYGLGITYG
ncbi:hypothetical protein K474DRAFT_1668586 [Panus rudis PR-1116 ss-1]|nr:hypothetical protein K474DRAFT_1668586 [Panus rudis PR-1116 ss-1]